MVAHKLLRLSKAIAPKTVGEGSLASLETSKQSWMMLNGDDDEQYKIQVLNQTGEICRLCNLKWVHCRFYMLLVDEL